MTLLFISLIAGILTVLSPCVLPLLPVIVGGSLAGQRSLRRTLTVTIALGLSVFLFTFLLKVSTAFIMVPASVWNWLSGGILFLVGIFFLFPNLWDLIPGTAKANRDSSKLMSSGFMRQNFWGDVLVGAALGPVFSSCSPTYFIVLATVLPVSLGLGVLDILAYVLGLSFSLLVVAFVGQRVVDWLGVAANPSGWLKKILGIIFILVGIAIVAGLDKRIEAPLYAIFDETTIEQSLLQKHMPPMPMPIPTGQDLSRLTVPGLDYGSLATTSPTLLTLAEKAAMYQKAPELVAPDAYLNTNGQPITLAQYRGKDVVLLDFWTYSCINCQRTLPYLTAWYAKYKDQGLVIIGVHTPEFAFEHEESNVAAALKQFGITYPVVLDNEYQTWNAYSNEYWPHEYVIDIDGYITHDHAGEGEYAETESAIQSALAERAERLKMPMATTTAVAPTIPLADLSAIASPETYFGAERNEYLENGQQGTVGVQSLTAPANPELNNLYLDGTWDFESQYATNQSAGAKVFYQYDSKNVYFVASGAAGGTKVEILQDGKSMGTIDITTSKLYTLVSNPTAGIHTLELIVQSPGLQAYTLTFG